MRPKLGCKCVGRLQLFVTGVTSKKHLANHCGTSAMLHNLSLKYRKHLCGCVGALLSLTLHGVAAMH